jgi:NADH:ubiquinone oxidoreductase subunit 3 (subunit A)
MEKKDLVWIILISVIVLILVSLTIPVLVRTITPSPQNLQKQQVTEPGQVRPGQQQPQGLEESRHLKTAISFINIGLIVPLFIIYAGIYRRMQSAFTLGLMAVIFALGMYAITSCPLIVSLLGGRTGDIGLFQILPDLCTTIALVILIRISME